MNICELEAMGLRKMDACPKCNDTWSPCHCSMSAKIGRLESQLYCANETIKTIVKDSENDRCWGPDITVALKCRMYLKAYGIE